MDKEHTRTKIVCTIGPASKNYDTIIKLIKAGMNVARLNFSHGRYEEHAEIINTLKKARQTLNCPLAIMLDTKGPEVRLGEISGGSITVNAGDQLYLGETEEKGTPLTLPIHPSFIINNLKVNSKILFDDGYISSKVINIQKNKVLVEIDHGGIIKSGKGVNIPGVNLKLPSLTEKDIADIEFACKHDLDYIAASFIRSTDDVLNIKNLLEKNNKSSILIISKIENSQGIQNFDSIVQLSDGVMIARGDLGVEVPLSQVPRLQKMMIRKCILSGKPSITATQMLESMTHNPRPTRAEVSDVANAIYDSTSMVMLSGETAVGKFPIHTVEVMKSIIKEAEEDCDYQSRFKKMLKIHFHDTPSAVTLATVNTAYSTGAKAIFILSSSGRTARLISRLRPGLPLLVLTSSEKVYHQLIANWGVTPVLSKNEDNLKKAYSFLSKESIKMNFVEYGDLVIVTAGSHFGVKGSTNMMMVKSIGDVLVRGHQGYGEIVQGQIIIDFSTEQTPPESIAGKILVITRCDESYLPFIKEAAGIILQNHIDDTNSENYALTIGKKLNTPTLVRADLAVNFLKEEQLVTLSPKQSLVYNGAVQL
jgi:pyruvate kinase